MSRRPVSQFSGLETAGRCFCERRCLVALLGYLGASSCGGRVDEGASPALVRAADDVGLAHRVLAIEEEDQIRFVSFDDPAEPREHRLVTVGEEEWAEVDWTKDASGLAVAVKSKVGLETQVGFAFSPRWTIQQAGAAHWSAFSTWLTSHRYLTINPGAWELRDVGQGSSSWGLLPLGAPGWTESVDLPFDLWSGWLYGAVVVGSLDDYVWFVRDAEPRYLNFPYPVSSIALASRDDRLVVVVDHDSPPEQVAEPNVWVVGAQPDPRCLDEKKERQDCLPSVVLESAGDETIILSSTRLQNGNYQRALHVAPWGAAVVLGAYEGPDESRILYQWETRTMDFRRALVDKWLYYLPSVQWKPRDGFLEVAPIVRVDTSLPLEEMKAQVVATVEMPGRPDTGARSLVRDGRWLSAVREVEGVAPRRWQMMDLRQTEVGGFQDTGFRGEYVLGLGERGLLFYDLGGSPFNAICHPCRYVAVEDVLDPESRRMEGYFEQEPPHHDHWAPIRGAPDDSGVLVKNGEVLEYRHFARPDVQFPLTHLTEDSRVSLPYSWNLGWYNEH